MGTTKNSIDEYIKDFPDDVQEILEQIRKVIKSAVPEAEECISYAMPAYRLNGKALVYFAAYKHHIGFYATPSGHKEFEENLSKYKQGKGSVQFPLNEKMPLELIKRIVRFRSKENQDKYGKKK